MPTIDAQPDAVAKVYAESLYELAEAQGGREMVEDTLGSLEGIVELARGDRNFREFIASRALGSDKRAASLKTMLDGNVDDLVVRFLLVLNEKDRLSHLEAITAAFDQAVQQRFGRVEVDVVTARPLDSEELNSVRDRLSEVLGKDVIARPSVDESIIGGVRFRIGDRLVDASVATRLRRMRDMLTDQGAAEIKARAGGLVDHAE